ncbi:alpha/beta fold hydrolase [Luteibacter yeojuensis]|uniref:AB hydrolase-1 domain-containing protein n=1 Tax=Luteibacter yeojuensis TaxID=345309 RepID=A0A0F3KJ67_9GAMM|nr:alpha/beta hydrolase [Luteibacter yeojuensis]KJV31305.1 hypothetical protein VI08_13730 [Luteibacter yeojuensis]
MARRPVLPRLALTAATLVAVTVLVVLAGTIYNTIAQHRRLAEAHVPGAFYKIHGHTMHIYCTGSGEPAIVLDTGLGDDFTSWQKVQPELSKVTRVCSYDRSGFGSSEMTGGPHDADTLSAALHDLVAAAGIRKPFILMGHSIAGIYLRSYASHYEGDLAGLVFVDGATPLQDERVPRSVVAIEEHQRRAMPWQKFLMAIGWYRLRGDCDTVQSGFEAFATIVRAYNCAPSQFDAIEAEIDAEPRSGQETVHAGPFPRLPILIFSRDPASRPPNWPEQVGAANAKVWNIMQEETRQLSPQSRRVIARGSEHYVHVDRPELVIDEVRRFVESIRVKRIPYAEAQPTVTR